MSSRHQVADMHLVDAMHRSHGLKRLHVQGFDDALHASPPPRRRNATNIASIPQCQRSEKNTPLDGYVDSPRMGNKGGE